MQAYDKEQWQELSVQPWKSEIRHVFFIRELQPGVFVPDDYLFFALKIA